MSARNSPLVRRMKLNHFSPRRVRGEKYFSGRKRARKARALQRPVNLAENCSFQRNLKKYAPVPLHWDESDTCRFVVPPKFGADCPLWPPMARGGCRGRFRPRSAAVLPLGQAGRFQPRASLSVGWGSEYCCGIAAGIFAMIICDFATLVKGFRRWGRKKDLCCCGNPGRPVQDPAPASRRWRCCWHRGCCCGHTGG